MTVPTLVVFAGLPGSGKTTLARTLADRLGATFLRVDSVDAAMTRWGFDVSESPVAYAVGHAIASDQLRSARDVVVDAVNPIAEARDGWAQLAAEHRARLRFIEVVCSDAEEHRRRVEARRPDLDGYPVPSWTAVRAHRYDPWDGDRLIVDNIGDPEGHRDVIERYVAS
ncbi:MAG: AAA family ATPase [Jatrophihabitans sp.]